MRPKARVEQAAIAAARTYATANGRPEDATAVGLFLAGLVIGARCNDVARVLLVTGYRDQFPGPDAVMDRWAQTIDEAATL